MKLTEAREWLTTLRQTQKQEPIDITREMPFLISRHAFYCPCRDITEEDIQRWLLSEGFVRWELNRGPSAQPDSFKLYLKDDAEDPELENRREIELVIRFFIDGCPPTVVNAWRQGSPRLEQGDLCTRNSTEPPCRFRSNQKPRGRI